MPKHFHERAYFSVVLNGGYTETFGRSSRTCQRSTIIFHPANDSHAVDFHRDVRIFRVEIDSDWLDRTRETALPETSIDFRGGLLSALGARLYSEFHLDDDCSALALEGLMLEIIAQVRRENLRKSERQKPAWLESAREMLTENFSEPPSLHALAETLGVHSTRLVRQFRRHYHCTIGEFVRRTRIEAACRELADQKTPVSVVSANAGFYDQSHFANTFKRYTGMTPMQYRAATSRGPGKPDN